jgi:hypothetical protein
VHLVQAFSQQQQQQQQQQKKKQKPFAALSATYRPLIRPAIRSAVAY